MNLHPILQNRITALAAGVVRGAVVLSILPSAAARQGSGDGGGTGPAQTQVMPLIPAFGTADSNGSMIAVTGIDMTGSSILYLVDTKGRHMAVYQASGGGGLTPGRELVPAPGSHPPPQRPGHNRTAHHPDPELPEQSSP